MLDKKLSELSGLTRTNLDGIDLVPVLDLNETVVNNRNKVLPIEELYQYIRRRFLAGGDLLYLLQGQNNTQNGYFNQISVNTINGNAFEGGNRVDFNGDVIVYVPGGIHASELVGISNIGSSIRILDTGAITVLQSLTESLHLTDDRRLLLGGANSRIVGNQYEELFQIESADPRSSGISIVANNNSESGVSLILAKTRADVVSGITAVKNNDELGSILFAGANGTHLNSIGARIQAAVDSSPFTDGENVSLPTRLTFFTTSATSSTPSERLCIDSTGLVSFNGDRDTGIYSSAPNRLDIQAGGMPAISATATGVDLYGQINLFGYNPYITTLDSVALTNNRTILFPDASGTVVVSNSVGSVTGQMLASNTIVNDNINANADIQVSKLKHGLPGQFLQTNSTGTAVEWGLDFTVPGSLNVKGSSVFEGPFIIQSNFQSASFIPNGISVPVLGMYAPQGNQLGFSTNTVLQLLIDINGQLKAGFAGTAALPTWTFNGDSNTGMYNSAADNLSFAVGGVEALRINSSGALGLAGTDFGTPGQILFTNGSAALPSWRTLSGDITINSSGVATISAGSIVDADINGAAAITDTKLATISSANKINIPAINLTGGPELGSGLQDTDLLLAHDDSSNARCSVLASRISDFVFSKVSGALAITSAGVASFQPSIGLTGVSTAPTATVDNNSTQIANTAFVVGQAASSLPLMNGSAAVGTSLRYARADHVHGADATKANLNSPGFTGVPTAPTAAPDTTTSQIATTAYVVNQGYLKSTVASGLYAPINSPGLTGAPTAPTADTTTNTTQLATTAFVKNVINSTYPGLVIKTACRLATTSNITLSGEQTIDGISALTNDRVLVKNQTTPSENGAYIVSTGAWSRAADFDSNTEVVQGSYFYIENGTTNVTTTWVLTTTGTIVVGTTALTFAKFSSADSTEAGSGLSKLGLTLNVGTASINRIVVNPDNIDLATTGVAAGTYQNVTVDAYGRVTSGTNPTTLAEFGITDAASSNQTMYIGTTQVTINRASGNLGLTGISSVVFPGSISGNITLLAAATAGTNTLTLPAVTGTFITSADSGTVSSGMIAAGAISNSNIASNAALDFSKLAALGSGQILLGNNSNVTTATSVTGDILINNTGVTSIASGVIVDADINTAADIQDTKLATISTAGKVSNSATTATSNNTNNTIVLRNASGDFSAGVVTATSFIGNGSGLTNLPASQIVGALSSGALSNSTLHVGTTQVALNRASANQALTGISSVTFPGATSGTIVLQPAATAGTNTLTLPAATGTLLSSGDIGSVTSTMIAANTITNTNINNSAGITLSKLESVTSGQIILGNASNIPAATAISGDISITNTGVVSISSGVITNDDINSNAAISFSKLESISAGRVVLGNGSNVATATAITGDITISSTGVAAIGTNVIIDSDISPFASIQDTKLATISSAGKVGNSATTATSINNANSIVLRDINGNFSAGTVTAINYNGNGSGLTNLSASQLTGTLPSGVLSNSFLYVGTTLIALNRGSSNQALTGISSLTLPGASSGAVTLQPAATAGNNTLTLPASTGTLLTSGDTGSVTGSVIASNTITNANINSNAAISFSKLENLSSGRVVLGNSSNVPTATSISGDITLSSFGVASIALGAVSDAHINSNASISGSKLAVISQANKIALSALDIDGGQDIAADLTDADLFIVDDGGAGNNRKVNCNRISTYVFGKVSGEIGITSTGESIVNAGKIMNYHISTSAAINGAKVVPGFGSQDISTSGACLLSQGTSTQVTAGSVNGKYFGNSGNSYVLWSARSGTSGASHILFQNGNGNVGQISTSGSLTSFNTTSDYRLKENITPIENSLERVLQLKPCRFNFKADPAIRVDGFLAHEADEVVPEAVVGKKDAVDENGNPIYQGIDQSKLVPLLTAALQETLQSIKALTARVEALEAR